MDHYCDSCGEHLVHEKEFDSKGAISFFFTLPKESFISEVHFAAKTAQNVSEKAAYKVKNSTSGFGEILHFPKEENLIFVDTSKFVTCQQEALGLINALDIFKCVDGFFQWIHHQFFQILWTCTWINDYNWKIRGVDYRVFTPRHVQKGSQSQDHRHEKDDEGKLVIFYRKIRDFHQFLT